jgi:hypothetical protein
VHGASVKTREVGLLFKCGASEPEKVVPTVGQKFSLEELQKYVGGYIELVPHANQIAYCNEEGRLRGLSFNPAASQRFNQVLIGDVIQITKEQVQS